MSTLAFNRAINLSQQQGSYRVNNLMLGNEPSNELHQYFVNSTIAGDKMANVVLSNYDLVWNAETRSITSQRVSRLGVKAFPHIGAIGFYVAYNEDRSYILAPIHEDNSRTDRPSLTVTVNEDSISFAISPNENQSYICYRIVMRLDNIAVEYVTYETSLVVDLPELSGTYDIYCIGYISEGVSSAESTHILQAINGTGVSDADNYIPIVGMSFDIDGYLILQRADGSSIKSDNSFLNVYDPLEELSRAIGLYPDNPDLPEITEEIGGLE